MWLDYTGYNKYKSKYRINNLLKWEVDVKKNVTIFIWWESEKQYIKYTITNKFDKLALKHNVNSNQYVILI